MNKLNDFTGMNIRKAANIMSCYKEGDDLLKSEGSRGGKVIGHTKSGKAIYDKFSHPDHKKFTENDHEDAAKKHMEELSNRKSKHSDTYHDEEAASHSREADKMKKNVYRDSSKKYDKNGKEVEKSMGTGNTPGKETVEKGMDGDADGAQFEKGDDAQKAKMKKVMDEWKSGKLKSSSGQKVTDQKQAIAIAMSEAGLSKAENDAPGAKKVVKKDDIEDESKVDFNPNSETKLAKAFDELGLNTESKKKI